MSEKMIQVECKLSDCLFYTTDPTRPGKIFCRHVEKEHYLRALPCPLYRMDIQKKTSSVTDASAFLKVLKRGK